jgi:type II restriction/modification system DNA methylase subunit YeeA
VFVLYGILTRRKPINRIRRSGKIEMAKIGEKIKEAVGAIDNLGKFKKFSKLKASYVEYDKFADSNLHEGYFCYNWISASGRKCMLVEDEGPDSCYLKKAKMVGR